MHSGSTQNILSNGVYMSIFKKESSILGILGHFRGIFGPILDQLYQKSILGQTNKTPSNDSWYTKNWNGLRMRTLEPGMINIYFIDLTFVGVDNTAQFLTGHLDKEIKL